MRDGTFFENLPCHLTEEEKNDRGREAAARQIELYEFKRLEKERAKVAKQKREELEKEIARLSQARHHGMEDQEVECYEQPNTTTYRIETIRTDTGEVVTSRKMDPLERQMAMQGELPFMTPEVSRAIRAARASEHNPHPPPRELASARYEEKPDPEEEDELEESTVDFKPLPPARALDDDDEDEDVPMLDGDGFPEE